MPLEVDLEYSQGLIAITITLAITSSSNAITLGEFPWCHALTSSCANIWIGSIVFHFVNL